VLGRGSIRTEVRKLIRIGFQPDDDRLTELMLYIAERSKTDPFFGAVKLNKILFRADFLAYRRRRRPITGHPYFRLPEGPAPQVLVKVRKRMIDAGDAKLETAQVFGNQQQRLVAKRSPKIDLFSAEELAIVDDLIDEMADQTASQATADSHRFPGWRAARDKEVIPYETAFLSSAITNADRVWALRKLRERGRLS
jgi:hypothetical protein